MTKVCDIASYAFSTHVKCDKATYKHQNIVCIRHINFVSIGGMIDEQQEQFDWLFIGKQKHFIPARIFNKNVGLYHIINNLHFPGYEYKNLVF